MSDQKENIKKLVVLDTRNYIHCPICPALFLPPSNKDSYPIQDECPGCKIPIVFLLDPFTILGEHSQ